MIELTAIDQRDRNLTRITLPALGSMLEVRWIEEL